MKKLIVFTSSALLSFTFCSCKNDAENKPITNVTTESRNLISVDEKNKTILGVWKLEGDENPTFEIKKDSIFYIEQGVMYRYKTNNDSICIFYEDWTYEGAFRLYQGKLELTDGDSKSKYVKWEPK